MLRLIATSDLWFTESQIDERLLADTELDKAILREGAEGQF
jgi:hypothetical protein